MKNSSALKVSKRVLAAIFSVMTLALCMAPIAFTAQTPGLTNGGLYNIRNRNSGRYLNVNLGKDANKINVIQWAKDGSAEQRFKLEYLSASSSYYLRAICSSNGNNRVLDVYRDINTIRGGCNADIWTPTDANAQQWLITGVGGGFFKITLRSNQNLALTAYGTANGSGGGVSAASKGNVFVSAYTGAASQQWSFERLDTPAPNKYAALGWSYFFRGDDAHYVGGYYYFNYPAGHMGIDVLAPTGIPVYSVTSGRVRSSYTAVNGGNNIYITPNVSTAGDQLDIGMYHFSKRNVATGAAVTANTILGAVGSTGNSTAPHVHLEISGVGRYTTNIGDHINPELFYPDIKFTHDGRTGGGVSRQTVYEGHFGAVPDSVIEYAESVHGPELVRMYLDFLYTKYRNRFQQENFAVENELLKFMKEFDVSEAAAAKRLDNVYTSKEFAVICRDEKKELNRTFVNESYAIFSDYDGEIYALDSLVKMELSEIRQKRLPMDDIPLLTERNIEGAYACDGSGREIISKAELKKFRARIS